MLNNWLVRNIKMAIRNMRSVNELDLPGFSQVFKHFREIGEQVFASLFVAGMEHLLMFCKGNFFEDFVRTVFGMLSKEQLETCKEHFFDVFEDFDELIEKKQMRILSSMIYDYNFTNLLTNIYELIEVPIFKSSENEELNELEYLCKAMKVSCVVLTPKWKEFKFLAEGSLVSVQILKVERRFYVLYPFEYQDFSGGLKEGVKKEEEGGEKEAEEDMRKVNMHEDLEEGYRSFSSGNTGNTRNTKRGLSVEFSGKFSGVGEDDKDSRMRNRAKLLKAKREHKRQEELKIKMEKEREAELARREKQRLEEENAFREEEVLRQRIRLEEENRILKEWKQSSESASPSKYTEDVSDKQKDILEEERQVLETQKKEVEILIQAKQELIEELQLAEEIRQREEKKLAKEILGLELKKREMEKSFVEEKRLMEQRRMENEKKLNEERGRIEEMRKAEEKRLEKEFRRIDERRLAQDRKIAEEKRLVAQRKLEDYRRQVVDKVKLSDARATPISVVGNTHGSFNGLFECVKEAVIEVHPQTALKIQKVEPKVEEIRNPSRTPEIQTNTHEKGVINIKRIKKDEPKVEEIRTPSRSSEVQTDTQQKGVRNIKRKITQAKQRKVEEVINDKEKNEEHKNREELNALEKAKHLMELRKIELEKILKDTKQLEKKRDDKRKKTKEALVLGDKKRYMEIIKKEEEKEKEEKKEEEEEKEEHKHETDKIVKTERKSPENLNKKKPSIEEILADCYTVDKKPPENLNESIEDVRKKYEEKMLENSSESPLSVGKNGPGNEEIYEDPILDTLEPYENSIIKLEKVPETCENLETYIGSCDNNTVCGGLYCAKCIKDLKKSSFVLYCTLCCNNYSAQGQTNPKKPASPKKKLICMNCTSNITKGDEVFCLHCFLQVSIYKKGRPQCEGCSKPESNYWIDATEGTDDEKLLCSFCNEKSRKEVILSCCEKCQDFVCFVCLRKNFYIAQGVCSVCHSRRQIIPVNP